MVFSSFVFLLLFLPLSLLCSFAVRSIRAKNAVLCAFSLLFYAWGEPVYLLLMLASILVNWLLGLAMARYPGRRRGLLILALLLNLGALGFFKYADFLLNAFNGVFGTALPPRNLPLPIGISFYTFQALSYVIDVYRDQVPAQRSLLRLAAYISLFPQLVAGPIVRYQEVERELVSRSVSRQDFTDGLTRLMTGLGKKVLLANQLALLADAVFDAPALPGGGVLWLGALAYMFQIYFDFSGYSDMAVGMGRMFGFHFAENFRYPYAAASVTDFWRRWHISLSGWFRDYVYIPLGGSRVSVPRHMLNLLLVWMLTGLWHGASWNFVLWGLYYGLLLILEKFVLFPLSRRLFSRREPVSPKTSGLSGSAVLAATRSESSGGSLRPSAPSPDSPSPERKAARPARLPAHILTLLAVLLGWILFRVEDVARLHALLPALFSFSGEGAGAFLASRAELLLPAALLPLAMVFSLPLHPALKRRFGASPAWPWLRVLSAGLLWLLSLAVLLGGTYNPFIYFRF